MPTVLAAGFSVVDLPFFAANALKIPHGGGFPLALSAVLFLLAMLFLLMVTWRKGRLVVLARQAE